MKRRTFVGAAGGLAALAALRVAAQGAQPPRVSIVSHSSEKAYGHLLQEFRAGFRSLSYVEGRDLILDVLWAEDRIERLPSLFTAALNTKPAVIVTHGSANVAAAQKATRTVPVVFASVGDPVGQGFIKSYGRPGGNITGVAFNDDVTPKVFELAKLIMPEVSRIGSLMNPDNPASKVDGARLAEIDKKLGIQTLLLEATNRESLEPAFVAALKAKMQAIVVGSHAPLTGLHASMVELQFKHALPTLYGLREGVNAGGLAGYSFPLEENYRRAAALVVQILKGGNPAEMPVEIPTRYDIAINMKTAEAMGIKVPESVLMRAHSVIR